MCEITLDLDLTCRRPAIVQCADCQIGLCSAHICECDICGHFICQECLRTHDRYHEGLTVQLAEERAAV